MTDKMTGFRRWGNTRHGTAGTTAHRAGAGRRPPRLRRLVPAVLLAVLVALPAMHVSGAPDFFNGVASYEPANGYDAPIFRQFAFVEGTVGQYVVLKPDLFITDHHRTNIYQFPMCKTLKPVLEDHHPAPGDGGMPVPHDAPTRRIVDVVLGTGCMVQPTSEAEVEELAVSIVERNLWVNAPRILEKFRDWPDEKLFNAPPYRPRIDAWQGGDQVQFITYEASWYPAWAMSKFPDTADTFVISYDAIFRPGFTVLNTADSMPNTETAAAYSPIWKFFCVVDADNRKCGISITLEDPAYFQCRSLAECTNMKNSNGKRVEVMRPPTGLQIINCPFVAVDLDGDDYIAAWEELEFPDLWADGPVIV